jgi:hypothetical protein
MEKKSGKQIVNLNENLADYIFLGIFLIVHLYSKFKI